MNLYLISQEENTGHDYHDSVIVAAKNTEEARDIHPSGLIKHYDTWVSDIKYVKVEYIGRAKRGTEKGVILASFNAG